MMKIPCTLDVLEVSVKLREKGKPVLQYTGVLLVNNVAVTSVTFSVNCEKDDVLDGYTDVLLTHISRTMEEEQA